MPLLSGLIPLLGILLKMLIVRIILATGLTFVTYAGYLSRRTGKVQRLHGKCDQFHAFRHIEPSFNFGIRSGVGLPVRRILVLHWYARIQKTDVCLSGMR